MNAARDKRSKTFSAQKLESQPGFLGPKHWAGDCEFKALRIAKAACEHRKHGARASAVKAALPLLDFAAHKFEPSWLLVEGLLKFLLWQVKSHVF